VKETNTREQKACYLFLFIIITSEKTGTHVPSFCSFYCANVWKLWTIFFMNFWFWLKVKI